MANEAHVRIDEGIKRGPRKNSREARGLTPKPRPDDLGSWKIPPELDPDEVIARYLTEDSTSKIAREYGLSRRAMVKWLREQRPKQWREAQLIRAHVKLEDAEDSMQAPTDPLSHAGARDTARAMQFRLTSIDPDYQPKQEIQHTVVAPTLNITVVSAQHAAPLLPESTGSVITQDGQVIDK